MLATLSPLLVDILKEFVPKYQQKTVAQLPTSKLCGFEQFGTGCWRTRININSSQNYDILRQVLKILHKIFRNEKKIYCHVA